MLPIVFLGPSLPRKDAQEIVRAEFRPPIKRGDIAEALAAKPSIMAIIDGEFFQRFAVSPKEIIVAIEA
jgi:hypothetical protein